MTGADSYEELIERYESGQPARSDTEQAEYDHLAACADEPEEDAEYFGQKAGQRAKKSTASTTRLPCSPHPKPNGRTRRRCCRPGSGRPIWTASPPVTQEMRDLPYYAPEREDPMGGA